MLTLHNATVVTPTEVIPGGAVVVDEGGSIAYAGPQLDAPRASGERLDLLGRLLVPGLIDIHTHGGNGVTFRVPGQTGDDLRSYSEWVAQTGVTGFLCSVAAPDADALRTVVGDCAGALDRGSPGAEGLGVHLEGPMLNPQKRGAFSYSWLRSLTPNEVDSLLAAGHGWVRQVTIAPELEGAGDAALRFEKAGVMVALGHSVARFELARDALRGSWSHVTHTFNAQGGFAHREPGVVGAVLGSDGITAELIADGVHVHPGAMRVLLRCLGPERIVLVTDGMAGAGMPDGEYDLLGERVTVRGGQARHRDGTLAGSTAALNACVRNLMNASEISVGDAVRMAGLNPARAIGREGRLGSIAVGKQANLTAVDSLMNVHLTLVRGRVVYNAAV
jgi:N-acetylglucosamine-6-phosphate deacetylase